MNRTEYIGKLNALYVGEKNCLEELITAYDEKDKEIERLQQRIDKAIEYIEDTSYKSYFSMLQADYNMSLDTLINILKGSDKE